MSMIKDIKDLNTKFKINEFINQTDTETLDRYLDFRIDFIEEELRELAESTTADDCVDALIDIIVVALGTLTSMNVDVQKAWDEVHKANMSKQIGINKTRQNEFGLPDLVKPKGWIVPDHSDNVGLIGDLYEQK